jgi:hypothetical protein
MIAVGQPIGWPRGIYLTRAFARYVTKKKKPLITCWLSACSQDISGSSFSNEWV